MNKLFICGDYIECGYRDACICAKPHRHPDNRMGDYPFACPVKHMDIVCAEYMNFSIDMNEFKL
jgi:hypothetical protein